MLNKFVEIRKTSSSDEAATTVAEELKSTEYQLKIGENMRILALTKIEGEVVESYVHSNNKLAAIIVAKA
jgi:elongation factor Ts